jgi:hypothetical protein
MIKLRGSKKKGYILDCPPNWCIAITWSELKAIAKITRIRVDEVETNKIFHEMLDEQKP